MNIDPVELFAPELLRAEAKGEVIAEIRHMPVSMDLKRAVYTRWCDLVNVPKEPIDFRALSRRPLPAHAAAARP